MPMLASVAGMHDTGKLFEPDTILPDQFYAMFKTSQYREPERRLMVAILEDAVTCLLTDPRHCNFRQRKHYEEAKEWVTADEESEWIFSFKNICEVLGMDPSYLRRGLIRQTMRGQSPTVRARHPAKVFRPPLLQRKIRIRTNC
jgi:hypothetical protein